jgi:hypothetical protein
MKTIRAIRKYFKDVFSLTNTVRQLERDVENLENKVLAPEKVSKSHLYGSYIFSWNPWDIEPARKMTLEEKVDALAEALNISFTWTEEQNSEVVAILPRPKKGVKKKK